MENNQQDFIIGEYNDTIIYPDGRVVHTPTKRNTIVVDVGVLIAGLMKNQENFLGLSFWAIGSGSDDWDDIDPVPAQPTDTGLVNEIGRKRIFANNIKFIDADGNDSETPTNRIKINIEFDGTECNGVWREFSLFGGFCTADVNSGTPINHKIHEKIVKKQGTVISREIRFTFRKGGVLNV